ncbi:GCN5 family N-acetyltransferase [Actinoplanes italicus]|uniref:N-acetylglutamate synthase-like GNAT family acetyltransferase n=1 Tax=Actinoplanes italicus TaxID=113567 RepID=A0A2T0K2Z0_9ACTN|nr:GNAT family N-acetyltransferase [Actinoplanes italicus]PRX17168.1 N-acetylglutamate synthase-like GNAT family acetyltransferase [Actinoplanes italicus]GIE30828.1 GCN5 family N-acetyltransferase [Actinoplanes italicus]
MRIRDARLDELSRLREIERAAGAPFREIGMPEIADDEPPSIEVLTGHVRAGRAWVAVAAFPVAYLLADLVDGDVHIEQVSVDPAFARRGIGRQLIEHAAAHARDIGAPALTLTTFAEVPWNAPYYARCGFVVLADAELTPGLHEIREHEAALGLDRWPRVCMRLLLADR